MPGIEVGELANMCFDLLIMPILILVLVRGEAPRFAFFLFGALCILISHIATVVEGYFFPEFMNLVEHLSILASGIFFLVGIFRYSLVKTGKK